MQALGFVQIATPAVCMTGLAVSLLIANVLRLDPGFAAGLMSGSLTESAATGTATDAINGLALPEAQRDCWLHTSSWRTRSATSSAMRA